MNELFVTLDPILDIDPMSMADWCASSPKSPENAALAPVSNVSLSSLEGKVTVVVNVATY